MIDVLKFIFFIVGMVAIIIVGLRLVRAKNEFETECLRSRSMSLYVVSFEPRLQDDNNPPRFLPEEEVTRMWKNISAAIFESGDQVISIKPQAYVVATGYSQLTVIRYEVSFQILDDARQFTRRIVGDVRRLTISFNETIELEA